VCGKKKNYTPEGFTEDAEGAILRGQPPLRAFWVSSFGKGL